MRGTLNGTVHHSSSTSGSVVDTAVLVITGTESVRVQISLQQSCRQSVSSKSVPSNRIWNIFIVWQQGSLINTYIYVQIGIQSIKFSSVPGTETRLLGCHQFSWVQNTDMTPLQTPRQSESHQEQENVCSAVVSNRYVGFKLVVQLLWGLVLTRCR